MILEKGKVTPEDSPLSAYLWMVAGANWEKLKDLAKTLDAVLELIEKCGFGAEWEAQGHEEGWKKGLEKGREEGREQGREEGLEQAVKRLQKYGMDPVKIAEALELPSSTVIKYLEAE